MLYLLNVAYTLNGTSILRDVTFSIDSGDKVVLEGNNGSGKTILFAIIQGKLAMTSGQIITTTSPLKIMSISESLPHTDQTVKDFLFMHSDDINILLAIEILAGLGMVQETLNKPLKYISAGNQMRLLIAFGIASAPDILLLDEPDKFLDIESKIYLTELLRNYSKTLILISHDNELKASVATKKITLPDRKVVYAYDFKINSPRQKLSGLIFSSSDASIGYDKPCVSGIKAEVLHDARVGILGRNGSNKSTICKLVAGSIAPLSGQVFRQDGLKVGYLSQEIVERLDQNLTVQQIMHDAFPESSFEELCIQLQTFELAAELMTFRISNLSSGERTRLAFVLLNKDQFNILVLDEPTIHLDQHGKNLLILAVNKFSGPILIISHDMDFLRRVTNQYWLTAEGQFSVYAGSLDDYRKSALQRSQQMTPLSL